MKIALVYDRVNKIGGAERVLEALHEIFPKAPLYTAVYFPKTAPWAEKFNIVPSFLNKLPFAKKKHEIYPYLMPLAFESFNFDNFDIVVSITSEAAKGIITTPKTLHICYCLTPTRYLWSGYNDCFKAKILHILAKPAIAYLRYWDKIASQRPDEFVAISKNVQKRIERYYNRSSTLIYPPVDLNKWKMGSRKWKIGNYFLIVSRLVPYKKINIAIEAFNELKLPLKIIGVGNQMKKLRKISKKNIEFLGQLTDNELLTYYQNCRAVIFPQIEDFGLVPLEAQACGKPVIAYRGGGALETIIEGKTGLFFAPQTPLALIKAIRKFDSIKFKPETCRQNAEKFSQEKFKRKFRKFIEEKWMRKN